MSVAYCATYEQAREVGSLDSDPAGNDTLSATTQGPDALDEATTYDPSEVISPDPAKYIPVSEETLGGMVHLGKHKNGEKNKPKHYTTTSASATSPLDVNEESVRDFIVGEINRIRKEAGAANMVKLSWDNDTQALAQQWADNCRFGHPAGSEKSQYLNTTSFSLGQNIAMGTGHMTWKKAIEMWHSEAKQFTFGEVPKNSAVVGHYTALVWASTSIVGCGYKLCPAGKMTAQASNYFVCNFGPAGNVAPNHFKPFEAGKACAKCSDACEDDLCTNACPHTNTYANCEVAVGSQPALFPKGCDAAGAASEKLKAGCQATCECQPQGKMY